MKTELNTINDCAAEQLYPLPPKITAAFYLGLVVKGNMVATRALPGEVSGWLLVISERQDYMISQAEFERAQVELDVQRARVKAVRGEGVDQTTFMGAAVLLAIEKCLGRKEAA